MAYSALLSLTQTINLILNPAKYFIDVGEKDVITSINEYSIYLISFFDSFPGKTNRLEGKIRYVANEAECLIEDFMWKQIHDRHCGVGVSNAEFEQQLRRISEDFGLITGDMTDDRGSPAAVISTSRLASTGKYGTVIGLEEELTAIKGRLCGDQSSKLEVIPILGMGGIGKTTLARCAYDDLLTVESFYIRAWVTISQNYSALEILSSLRDSLKSFDKKMIAHEDEATMRDKVYKCLKGRRYLIVMDDVWSTKALDDVRNIFPNDYNGSRIMLTTRLSDVATYVSGCLVHEMKFMDGDQCWILLKEKVFPNKNGGCPSELEDVGKNIARSCSGLPLAIVLLAGVLSKVVETRDSWEEIAKNANSIVGGQLEKILSLSYNHLPHHLRSCFLYMGGFPEDHEVSVSGLIRMWAAEGFLKCPNEFKSMEEEAGEYLEDLVERSLVLVTKSKSNGKIKSCGLHDLVRDLCIRKAREEKFFVHAPDECIDVRRLSITNSDYLNDICGSDLRTILYIQQLKGSCSGSLDFLKRSKLLRVLLKGSCSGSAQGYSCSGSLELFHLRYLAFPDLMDIPSAIYKFENLHTLIIGPKSMESMRKFELEVFRMPQLRHLLVYSFYAILYSEHESALPLENLQTLSCVINPLCDENFLEMCPNVKKLGLILSSKNKDHQLYNLGRLDKLEKLKVTMNKFSWKIQNLAFPSSLKKLTLYGWEFPRNYMTIVGSLPNLEVLKLMNHACGGGTWETADGEFLQLKFLLIERSTLHLWKTECSHFPKLECLILRNCWSLTQVPYDIGDISTLEMIEVDLINKLLVDSAKKIQEDQRSYGNVDLQVRFVDCLHQSTSFEKTSGKMCYMIGARELLIRCGEDPEKWQWKACADSRFGVVAELKKVDFLDIKVSINTLILSSNTKYIAYLVFKLAESYCGHESALAFVTSGRNEGYPGGTHRVVHLKRKEYEVWRREYEVCTVWRDQYLLWRDLYLLWRDLYLVWRDDTPVQRNEYPVWRDDGWMEVEIGSFFNEDDGEEAVAMLAGTYKTLWKGLIVEGIEFRPETYFDFEDERQIISLEEMSGKKCYIVAAKLMAGWSDNWQWKACADSRFAEVAEFIDVRWLDIRVRIQTQMLSTNTTYAVCLVYKLAEDCCGLESTFSVVKFVDNDGFATPQEKMIVVHLRQRANDDDGRQEQNGRYQDSVRIHGAVVRRHEYPVWRDDGWMEVEIGRFYNGHDGEEVEARLMGMDDHAKSGLIIEGFEFRTQLIDLKHKSHIISLEMSGKKCCIIGSKLMTLWSDNLDYWPWKPCADSRFLEVAELFDACSLDMRVRIQTLMLSRNTSYAAYLVFKLADRCYGLKSTYAVLRSEGYEGFKEKSIIVHLQQVEDDDGLQEQNGRQPVWRDDGWMEVKIGLLNNDDDYDDAWIEVRLTGIDGRQAMSGLIFEGIEFRPDAFAN